MAHPRKQNTILTDDIYYYYAILLCYNNSVIYCMHDIVRINLDLVLEVADCDRQTDQLLLVVVQKMEKLTLMVVHSKAKLPSPLDDHTYP